jgi:hypothetical protein
MDVALRAERALRAYSLGAALDDLEVPGLPEVALTNSIIPPQEALDLLAQLAKLPAEVTLGITKYAVALSAGLDGFELEEALDIGDVAAKLQAESLQLEFFVDTVLLEALELALVHRDDPHAAAVAASNNLVAAVSGSLIAATGGWSETAQDASELFASVREIDFNQLAAEAVAQRGRLLGEIDV